MEKNSGYTQRLDAKALLQFSTLVLEKAGLSKQRAQCVARILLEGDLLGFRTHGLQRLRFNVEMLKSGKTKATGDAVVLTDHGAAFSLDAEFLPGPWVVREAIEEAARRAETFGVGVATIRRAQHVASLGAYLPEWIDKGYAVLIAASTPDERVTVSPDGIVPLLSNTPIAFGAPTTGVPLLFDFSMAAATMGSINSAKAIGESLPYDIIRLKDGTLTNDPNDLYSNQGAGILPFGAPTGGHKGFILSLFLEVLSASLNGYGPLQSQGDQEANCIYLQVFRPLSFSKPGGLQSRLDELRSMFTGSIDAEARFPGQRAWQARSDQKQNGVIISRELFRDLKSLAKAAAISADFRDIVD